MYKVPEFPLDAHVHGAGFPFPGPPRVVTVCNIGVGRRVAPSTGNQLSGDVEDVVYQILLPAGVDVRDNFTTTGADFIEAPAGSGRLYLVVNVNDIGQGFANEHRVAFAVKAGVWPAPLPPVFVVPGPAA